MVDIRFFGVGHRGRVPQHRAGHPEKQKILTEQLVKRDGSVLNIQQRLLKFVTRTNWILLAATSLIGLIWTTPTFAKGIIFGGLIVTVNFHLLYRTLKRSLTPDRLVSHNVILAKYYVRFIVSGLIIFLLISQHIVDPIGLFIGLSVVVASIMMATVLELKNLFFKEAA